MITLYLDSTIRKGKVPTRLARLAPAPRATKIDGKAQQIKVEEEAKREKKFAVLSEPLATG
ncbi:MAG: hypothetical protein P8Q37_01425 [Porticoccaceae bacterium]|nr:hypothetical protein [Porticoccaceae bacterium]MDG1473535.1 hypothetical protein [Porticoccaceae bacterium]